VTFPNGSKFSELIKSYSSGEISRRELFQKLAFVAGSLMAAQEIMASTAPFVPPWMDPIFQQQAGPTPKESIAAGEARVPENVETEWVKYRSGDVEMTGYLARPKAGGSHPAIIIIHENRGLTEFVLEIAKRWAAEGFIGLAPDFLSRRGGTANFASMAAAGEGIGTLKKEEVVSDLHATVTYLKTRKEVKGGRLVVSGFCWGGGHSFNFATESKELKAALVFYGIQPNPIDKIANLGCPVLGIYGELDTRIDAGIPDVEAAAAKYGKKYEKKIYTGANHAFMNFTGPRYDEAAAKDAWATVVAFVKKQTT
jgi:carboxymethylenebutenolidase